MPFHRRSGSRNTSSQVQPTEPRRGHPAAGKLAVFGDEFDVPAVRHDPRDHERQRGLGELEKRFAIPVSGDEEVTGDFRSLDVPPPDNLTFAEGPTRFGEIGLRKGRGGAARAPPKHGHQPEQRMQSACVARVESDRSKSPSRTLWVHCRVLR